MLLDVMVHNQPLDRRLDFHRFQNIQLDLSEVARSNAYFLIFQLAYQHYVELSLGRLNGLSIQGARISYSFCQTLGNRGMRRIEKGVDYVRGWLQD